VWQPPPPFSQFTPIVHQQHHHEKLVPKLPSTLAHFPYGARAESGGGCHTHSKALRAPSSHDSSFIEREFRFT
jgi:hypothetical protein